MYNPSPEQFAKLAQSQKGNLIPVYREILADLETPVSAYFKIAQRAKYSFLLESVEGEEKVARFSFLARDPEMVFQCQKAQVQIHRFKDETHQVELKTLEQNPLQLIREIMKKYKLISTPGLPRFCGGLVGYMGYDMVRFFERLPDAPTDDLNIPDILLILAKDLIIFDHSAHKIKVVSCAEFDPQATREEQLQSYERAVKQIDQLIHELNRPLSRNLDTDFRKSNVVVSTASARRLGIKNRAINIAKGCSITARQDLKIKSNVTEKEFVALVLKAKKKIISGDIIQVVLSQRFEVEIKTTPINIYRTLRAINPSPYMYFLNFNEIQIIGSSPELLVRSEKGVVETRPIAGTRPRGKTEQEDRSLKEELLNDPKERAEHVMLVDLGRNDLGRVCEKGSVQISEFMEVEKYSHVMHLVSNVKGRLQKRRDVFDVLQAAFPAGTVSGAPKIRAMEIIDELESVRRGPYAGAIGYFSFSGNLDSCITIRTIVVSKNKAYIQAGAGIVADSIPKNEYAETVNKAKAQIMAVNLAHQEGM